MEFDHSTPLKIEGFTFLKINAAFVRDRHTGRRDVIPVYHYRDNETGALVLTTEGRYEETLDRLIAMTVSRRVEGRA